MERSYEHLEFGTDRSRRTRKRHPNQASPGRGSTYGAPFLSLNIVLVQRTSNTDRFGLELFISLTQHVETLCESPFPNGWSKR
jgi:hypothetical protein